VCKDGGALVKGFGTAVDCAGDVQVMCRCRAGGAKVQRQRQCRGGAEQAGGEEVVQSRCRGDCAVVQHS
jgi:hypothetical protein